MKLTPSVACLLASSAFCTVACSDDASNEAMGGSGGTSSGGSDAAGGDGGTGGSGPTGGAGGTTGGTGGAIGGMGGDMLVNPHEDCPNAAGHADLSCECTTIGAGNGLGGAGVEVCFDYPAACGPLGDYAAHVGTAASDTIDGGTGSDLYAGLAGDDVLVGSYGNDCYLGGSGDDRLEQSGEASSHYMLGGPGADTFVFRSPSGNDVTILDFSDEDAIALDWDAFARGAGAVGETVGVAFEVQSNFVAGAEPSTADTRIIYDDTDGELFWEDGESSHLIGTIDNFDEVTVDESDFVWE